MNKKKKDWRAEKERLLSLGLEDRRKEYRGKEYVSLEKIPSWRKQDKTTAKEVEEDEPPVPLSDKVSLYRGDITILEVDAIVNAANSSLLGGGGVDGCIHRAAGRFLYEECLCLGGCGTGKAKITCGYHLPAKHVIHTVGPIARGVVGPTQEEDLESCYKNSLQLVKDHGLRSVAFPCISTGIYGFPNKPAADIALETVKNWIKKNKDAIDRVIFCVFLETDYEIYKEKMPNFFSADNDVSQPDEGTIPPSKKSKNKNEDGEEESDEEEEPEDAEMESQREDECVDAEMESQRETFAEDPETTSEKKDLIESSPVPAVETKPVAEEEEARAGSEEGSGKSPVSPLARTDGDPPQPLLFSRDQSEPTPVRNVQYP